MDNAAHNDDSFAAPVVQGSPVPGVTTCGTWRPFPRGNAGTLQHGVELCPTTVPWRQLVDQLDVEGTHLSDDPVPLCVEADAIVACCFHYGSYLHVLAQGEDYPRFRASRRLARLTDPEMHRINLEFSSGVAAWLSTRAADPARIARRVRAAQLLWVPERGTDWRWEARHEEAMLRDMEPLRRELEKVWNAGHALAQNRIRRGEDAAVPSRLVTLRQEANWLVWDAYQGSPVGRFRAGARSQGTDVPGYLRFTPSEVEQLADRIAERITIELRVRNLDYEKWRYLVGVSGPADWSLTDETTAVRYPDVPGYGPLHDRLAALAARLPTIYGARGPAESDAL